eukprot:5221993-Amphidinium_carterae.1
MSYTSMSVSSLVSILFSLFAFSSSNLIVLFNILIHCCFTHCQSKFCYHVEFGPRASTDASFAILPIVPCTLRLEPMLHCAT